MLFEESFVEDGDPALDGFVEFVLGAVGEDEDVLFVELGEGDAVVGVEEGGVGGEGGAGRWSVLSLLPGEYVRSPPRSIGEAREILLTW